MSDTVKGKIVNPKDILWEKPNLTTVGLLKYFEEKGYVIVIPPNEEQE